MILAKEIDFETQTAFSILVEATDGQQTVIAEIQVNVLDDTLDNATSLGNLGEGIAANDYATGSGFLMYSSDNLHERFSANPLYPTSAEQIVAVRFYDGQWQYDTNWEYVNFTPTENDVLIAKVNFSSNKVNLLDGENSDYKGVRLGFVSSDIQIKSEVWNGSRDRGEFYVTGSTLTLNG